jgi:hypothetical protein
MGTALIDANCTTNPELCHADLPAQFMLELGFYYNHYHEVRFFSTEFTLEDAIGSHACSLEASSRVTNGIPLGCPRFLPVHTVNCVQTLKAFMAKACWDRAQEWLGLGLELSGSGARFSTEFYPRRCYWFPYLLA